MVYYDQTIAAAQGPFQYKDTKFQIKQIPL